MLEQNREIYKNISKENKISKTMNSDIESYFLCCNYFVTRNESFQGHSRVDILQRPIKREKKSSHFKFQ